MRSFAYQFAHLAYQDDLTPTAKNLGIHLNHYLDYLYEYPRRPSDKMVEQLQMLRDRLGWESDLEFYGRAMRNFQRIDSLFSPYSPADYADLLLALSNVDYKFLLDFEMGMEKQVRARLKTLPQAARKRSRVTPGIRWW